MEFKLEYTRNIEVIHHKAGAPNPLGSAISSLYNYTHLILIPKNNHLRVLVDFRLISLYNIVYKIITKS